MSNKIDSKSGIGELLKVYSSKVYSLHPNPNNEFVDENYNCIAKRVTLDLVQDSVYKTQFKNELLACALKPITETTKLVFYDENGLEIDPYPVPELNLDFASIVFQIEPVEKPVAVSVVIYTGPTFKDILLSDGSIQMQEEYSPVQSLDIATKEYVDKIVENFTALSYPLKNFNITQENFSPVKGICYLNNQLFEKVLFAKNHRTAKALADCTLKLDSFAIPNTFSKNTQIGLCVNGTTTHSAYLKDVIAGTDSTWKLLDSENVYTTTLDQVYWRNAYSIKFNLSEFPTKYSATKPYIDFKVKIWDEAGHVKYSDVKTYGIDEYIEQSTSTGHITYLEATLNNYKTKYISGKRYLPDDPSIIYDLTVKFEVGNDFLMYYRPETTLKVLIINKDDSIFRSYELPITYHQPVGGYATAEQKIEFNSDIKYLRLQGFNVKGEIVFEQNVALNAETNTGTETNRVTTPSADVRFPTNDYGAPWDSTKDLEDFEMELKDNIYVSDNNKSAICLAVPALDCYSHVTIDADTDGHMYILSEGNTGWLDCEVPADAFVAPVTNGKGCKMNENYFTFGKVNYSSRIFIRVLGATRFELKSAILG